MPSGRTPLPDGQRKTVQFTVTVTEKEAQILKAVAESLDITASHLIRKSIGAYIPTLQDIAGHKASAPSGSRIPGARTMEMKARINRRAGEIRVTATQLELSVLRKIANKYTKTVPMVIRDALLGYYPEFLSARIDDMIAADNQKLQALRRRLNGN